MILSGSKSCSTYSGWRCGYWAVRWLQRWPNCTEGLCNPYVCSTCFAHQQWTLGWYASSARLNVEYMRKWCFDICGFSLNICSQISISLFLFCRGAFHHESREGLGFSKSWDSCSIQGCSWWHLQVLVALDQLLICGVHVFEIPTAGVLRDV